MSWDKMWGAMWGADGRGRGIAQGLVMAGMLLAAPRALALDPALDVSQYAHTAWKISDGFAKGSITAIAQTPEGYLWLGTEFGLFRFDGVRNVPWASPAGQQLPGEYIRSLLVSRDGTLWIGTLKGLASWKGGKLTQYADLTGQSVDALLEDHEGILWIGSAGIPSGRLCSIRNGTVQCSGQDGNLGNGVESLYEDSRNNVWAATATGLWRCKPGPAERYPMPDLIMTTFQTLVEDDGALLIATRGGIRRFVDGKTETYSLPGVGGEIKADKLFKDHQGALWIATFDEGLVHVHQGKADVFARPDGLSGDSIDRFFEDREGNLWVATMDGLDRFRDLPSSLFPRSKVSQIVRFGPS